MYTTAPTITEAKTISQYLVTEKLAACVNIMPNIQSVYEWEGKVEESAEFLLMIKVNSYISILFSCHYVHYKYVYHI